MSARILIITGAHLSRNPRPVKEADTLAAAGYEVAVLGWRNHPYYEDLDRTLRAGAPWRWLGPDWLTADAGRLRRLVARGRVALARRLGRPSWWIFGPVDAYWRAARAHAADLTIVHTELGFHLGTRLLAAGGRVAADFEDWHSEDLPPADRRSRPVAALRAAEGVLLQRAAYCSTTSQALSDALATAFAAPAPIVLPNAFPLQPAPTFAAAAVPSLLWFSQTIGPGRGLEAFLQVWAQTKTPSRVVLLGAGSPAYLTALRAVLPADKQPHLEMAPPVPPADLPSAIARHTVGLALESSELRSRDLTITNKILQYLNAGLAVIATATAGQREVLDQAPGAGWLLPPRAGAADTADAARRLDAWLGDPAGLLAARRAARAAAEQRYCWERVSPTLLAAVHRALAGAQSFR